MRSGPIDWRTAASTSRVKRRRSWPYPSARWLVSPDWNWRSSDQAPASTSTPCQARRRRPGVPPGRTRPRCRRSPLVQLRRWLPRHHVGHPGRRPQHRLRVGAGALATGVAEAGQDDRSVGPAGLGDGPPAGPAVGRQGGPLVGPVVRGDRRRLGDDHARTAAGPPGVVGDVAVADGAAAPQVGLVGPEHHPRGRELAPDDDGFGEHGGRH